MSSIRVEVVYALKCRQSIISVDLPDGSTIRDAIIRSGVLSTHPEVNLDRNRVGIWSRVSRLDTMLQDGDRVEIYRPLEIDPMHARRQRAIRSTRRAARGNHR